LSLVAASFFVLRQSNYKRLLAYSSIEHMGIVALGIGFGAPLAIAGALLHVITHASAKGLAFFGAGSLLRGYETKEIDAVTDAGRRMPWTGSMVLTAALALSGLPLSGVFRSEFEIVVGGFARAQYVGVVILIVFANLAFCGIIWNTGRMVLGARLEGSDAVTGVAGPRERSVWMIAAMLGCFFVVVALGVHVPGDLSALLGSAGHALMAAGR
ncbi:MAG: proton-conducting transporter membrane subunit, partial [Solirubrobacteraceae bacterium]